MFSFLHRLGPASQNREHSPGDILFHLYLLSWGPSGESLRESEEYISLWVRGLCALWSHRRWKQTISCFSHKVLLRTPWGFLVGTLSLAGSSTQAETFNLSWQEASFLRPWSFGVMSPTASLPASLCWRLLTLWTYHSSLMSTLLSHCGETPISLDLQTLGGQSHLNTAII